MKAKEFDELFTEHYQLLYHTAYGVTGHRREAEQVLQSVFLRLLQDGVSPELKRNPAQGLHREVMNLSLIVIRARRRQMRDTSLQGECHEQLMASIARLKLRAFVILLLHYKHDYSDAQIATLLGSSPGTIAVTLSRVRTRLRKKLRAIGHSGEVTTRDSLRELINRHVPLPSYGELAESRDRILRRVHAIARQLPKERKERVAAVAWWGAILDASTK